jgi:CRP-like cAMP-binding protein
VPALFPLPSPARLKENLIATDDQAVPANRLLARLAGTDRASFLARCETVELQVGEVLMRRGARITHAYFPLNAIVSLGVPEPGGRDHFEVALVGREGMVGVPLLLGSAASSLRAIVVAQGATLRMAAAPLRLELEASQGFAQRMQQYVLVALTQMAQAAICTRSHRVEARLARWLLMMQDRAPGEALHATHEVLATALGVRRAGVTQAAASLQQRHLIAYRRGLLMLLDRDGLKTAACGCYAADRASYANAMRQAACV